MRSHCNRSRAGAAGVAALAFAALMPVSAAADPAVNPAAAALDRHQQGVEAFNAHHVEAVADIYAEDAILRDPQAPEPIQGREAIRETYEKLFRAFPDAQVTMLNVYAEGDLIMYELQFSGTNDGPIVTPEGDIPATGQRIEMPQVVVSEVDEDGRFRDTRRYYDTAEVTRQLAR